MFCQPYNQGVSFCVELAPPHTSKKVKNVQVVSELDHIYVRVFLQISASLHDNAKLARVGVARAAHAHGLTELFLIKYFALLYVRSNITLHDPFLRIIIWTT